MKVILTTLTILALCAGLSGCMFPVGNWRGDPRDSRYGQGYQDRLGRDCSRDDNHWYCRGDGW